MTGTDSVTPSADVNCSTTVTSAVLPACTTEPGKRAVPGVDASGGPRDRLFDGDSRGDAHEDGVSTQTRVEQREAVARLGGTDPSADSRLGSVGERADPHAVGQPLSSSSRPCDAAVCVDHAGPLPRAPAIGGRP